jgi:hypothetical protein
MAINQYDQRMYAEYTPLTQQEILMPAMYMRERHDKLEQEYGDLNSELKKISFIVDNERDPQLKAKYQSYLNDLNGAITELDQNGFTPTGKNRALALKAKYNEEILPIPTAYGLKMADIAHYKELKAKDPSYIGVDPYQRSVTDYVNNGNQPMNNPGISGAYIQKLASEAFSAISKTSDYSELHRLLPNINLNRDEFANIYTYMQHNGIDPESDTGKMLTQKVRDYVIGATGVSAWAGQQEIAQIDDHIRIASYQMLGETKSQIINGQSGITSGKKTTKNDNDGSTYSP